MYTTSSIGSCSSSDRAALLITSNMEMSLIWNDCRTWEASMCMAMRLSSRSILDASRWSSLATCILTGRCRCLGSWSQLSLPSYPARQMGHLQFEIAKWHTNGTAENMCVHGSCMATRCFIEGMNHRAVLPARKSTVDWLMGSMVIGQHISVPVSGSVILDL
jgi:hypothetical protein